MTKPSRDILANFETVYTFYFLIVIYAAFYLMNSCKKKFRWQIYIIYYEKKNCSVAIIDPLL